jgi:hypothetical protein
MQMIRVRSPLYFEQKRIAAKNSPAGVIEEISEDRKSIKFRPIELDDSFIKNCTLTEMKAELKKGVDDLNNFDWALHYCESPKDSFLTCDTPFVAIGPVAGQEQVAQREALQHPDTKLYFPLCWQACIVGSPCPFDIKTERATTDFLQLVRQEYRKNAKSYLISPVELSD